MSVQHRLEQLLRDAFQPSHLELANESHMHSVPPNSETHFRLVLVSDRFSGMRPVQRHQSVYATVSELMNNPVHALALHTFAPEEWIENPVAPASPECMGGSKRDANS